MAIRVFKKVVKLPAKPPGLEPAELEAYRDLVAQIKENETDTETPLENVLVAARQKARLERMIRDYHQLKDLLIETMTNPARVHPLVQEIRNLEKGYMDTLGRLCLTTSSKATAKNQGGLGKGDSKSSTPFDRALNSLDFDD